MLKRIALLAAAVTLTVAAFADNQSAPGSTNPQKPVSKNASGMPTGKWKALGQTGKKTSTIQLVDKQGEEPRQWNFVGSSIPVRAPKGKRLHSAPSINKPIGSSAAIPPSTTPAGAITVIDPPKK